MSTNALGALLLVALLVLATAHVALLVAVARRRSWGRALAALLVPPLAPLWGWEVEARRWTLMWIAALGLYAVGVVVTTIVR